MPELKRTLGGLERSLASALETIHVSAFVLDLDGSILWQNSAFIDRHGSTTGHNLRHLIDIDDWDYARRALRRIVAGKEALDLPLCVLNADDTRVFISLSAAPIIENESVVGILGLSHEPSLRVPPAAGADRAGLTVRQIEVVRLLADGRGTAEIASDLSLSQTTVRNHIAKVISTLRVHSRLQAVVAANKAGLLKP